MVGVSGRIVVNSGEERCVPRKKEIPKDQQEGTLEKRKPRGLKKEGLLQKGHKGSSMFENKNEER